MQLRHAGGETMTPLLLWQAVVTGGSERLCQVTISSYTRFWTQRATPSFFKRPATLQGSPRSGAPRPGRLRDTANHEYCRAGPRTALQECPASNPFERSRRAHVILVARGLKRRRTNTHTHERTQARRHNTTHSFDQKTPCSELVWPTGMRLLDARARARTHIRDTLL